jgi:secreted trypsin-like serine protease
MANPGVMHTDKIILESAPSCSFSKRRGRLNSLIQFQYILWISGLLLLSPPIMSAVGGNLENARIYEQTGALITRQFGWPLMICTATLIAPRVLITAAHCSGQSLLFTLNADVNHSSKINDIPVRRFYVNPAYNLRSAGSIHDIALVELEKPINNVGIESILTPAMANTMLHFNRHVSLVGYGKMRVDETSFGKKNAAEATITYLNKEEMIIGAVGTAQNCDGDSGGPAFLTDKQGTRWLVGIASRSVNELTSCTDGSIHTRIDAYAYWINLILHTINVESYINYSGN